MNRKKINKTRVEKQTATLEKFSSTITRRPEDYTPYIGKKLVEELKQLANPLEDRTWANVNSTFLGGGVAEMLHSVIPFVRGLGIHADWHVIQGHEQFFQVTKKFHNLLQGLDQRITMEEIFGAYLDTIDHNSMNTFIASDMVVIHDPQPAAMIMNGVIFGNILWRCHIDTSTANQIIWRFLLPYINQCSGAIFTMPEYTGPGLQIPLYQIFPCIDPLAEKNHHYTEKEASDALSPYFERDNIDPERPILAAISRYDVHKNQGMILRAFKRLRKQKKWHPPPYLIFLGNSARDDPEGDAMLARLKEEAGDNTDIIFWTENNNRIVGALMKIAMGCVHVSTREGFGLVVTEALWQGTPVIGSRVGGIVKQVIDGRTGYLVHPLDEVDIASKMARLLENPKEAEKLGKTGQEHVRNHFLLPELVRRYLILLRFYTGIDAHLPPFRMDGLSYSEILQAMKIKHPYLRETPNSKNK